MDRDQLRLAVAAGAGFAMSGLMWLFVSERSPAFHYLRDQADAGVAMLILNFPALFLARLLSQPTDITYFLYILCFLQWFAIGLLVASFVGRSRGFQANRQKPP